MSTKIYVAYRFPKSRINEFLDLTRDQVMKKLVGRANILMDAVKPEAVMKRAREIFPNDAEERITKKPKLREYFKFNCIEDLLKEASQSPYRNEIYNLDCGVNIWFKDKYCYAIPISADWIGFGLHYPEWVEDYGYWNNTDKPDRLTNRQWKARMRVWESINLGSGKSSHNSRRLYYEIFDGSSIHSRTELQLEVIPIQEVLM